jgi:hypothetical protein
MNIGVIKQVVALPDMKPTELRDMWRELFNNDPPTNNKTFLVKRLSYRIQELAYGGLSEATIKRLASIVREEAEGPKAPIMANGQRQKDQPLPGTRLIREWQGVEHLVTALEKGFEYQGQKFKSLSAVAREITGTQWNGPLFFGLRRQGDV